MFNIKNNPFSDLQSLEKLTDSEIITPFEVVKKMVELLPEEVFTNLNNRFIDVSTKSGIYLKYIFFNLLHKLPNIQLSKNNNQLDYELDEDYDFTNLDDKKKFILRYMIYGIATSELSFLTSKRTLYENINENEDSEKNGKILSKPIFKNWEGNIIYKKLNNEEYWFLETDIETINKELTKNIILKKDKEMKFNVIIGNPPYLGKSATHQKMFNRGVDRLKEGGYICFIQPSTTYHNKKKFSKTEEQIMYDNISKFKTKYVEILSPNIFKGVDINNDISITLLEKIESNNGKIDKIKYKNNEIYEDILLEDISMTEIKPSIYSSIKSKYFKYIKKNGSLYDISYFDKTNTLNNNSAGLSTIRGHKNKNGELKNDFFTFLSRNDLDKKVGSKHYINCNSSEIINVHNYLMTKFSRFSLTFLKFNTNLHMGELRAVPKVDFSKKWTDEELYDLIRLTKEERKIIDNYIPEWNHYGK